MTATGDSDSEASQPTDRRLTRTPGENGKSKRKGRAARSTAGAGAAGGAARNAARAKKATAVSDTLSDISKGIPVIRAARSEWLKDEATRTINGIGLTGKSGLAGA